MHGRRKGGYQPQTSGLDPEDPPQGGGAEEFWRSCFTHEDPAPETDPPDPESRVCSEERPKRIRLTVEWVGACSEAVWADCLTEEIENCDLSQTTVVIKQEALTSYGETPKISRERYRELGFKPKPWPPPLTWRERLRRALWRWRAP